MTRMRLVASRRLPPQQSVLPCNKTPWRIFGRLHQHSGMMSLFVWMITVLSYCHGQATELTPIVNSNIKQAVDLWTSNPSEAKQVYGDIREWNTSSLSVLQYVFVNTVDFDADLSRWDVSHVTSMFYLFFESQHFAANVSTWDTSHVRFMGHIFESTQAFSSDVSGWDTSQVETMVGAFNQANQFASSITNWNVSSLTDGKDMFRRASFTQSQSICWSSLSIPADAMFDLCTSENVVLDCTCMEAYLEENEISCWRSHLQDTDGSCPFISDDGGGSNNNLDNNNQNTHSAATTTTLTHDFSVWTSTRVVVLVLCVIAMLPV